MSAIDIAELKDLLSNPKPKDDPDLIQTVSEIMDRVGMDKNYIDLFKRTMDSICGGLHSKIQRQHISIFLVTDIGLIEMRNRKEAIGLRYMVLTDTELDEWLKIVENAALPFIKNNGEVNDD